MCVWVRSKFGKSAAALLNHLVTTREGAPAPACLQDCWSVGTHRESPYSRLV